MRSSSFKAPHSRNMVKKVQSEQNKSRNENVVKLVRVKLLSGPKMLMTTVTSSKDYTRTHVATKQTLPLHNCVVVYRNSSAECEKTSGGPLSQIFKSLEFDVDSRCTLGFKLTAMSSEGERPDVTAALVVARAKWVEPRLRVARLCFGAVEVVLDGSHGKLLVE